MATWDEHNAQFGVTRVERCCGTCDHFQRVCEDGLCYSLANRTEDGEQPWVDEGCICPRWIRKRKDGGAT